MASKPGPVDVAIRKYPHAYGLAIIISNDYCGAARLNELTGTLGDGKRMKATFESIRFAVVHQQNVSLSLLQQLTYEATQVVRYPESYKSICFVFSGHGGCDTNKDGGIVLRYLYDQQGRKMEIANIWKPFMPKAAARIGNIPKVFFIDACRGDREMHLEAVMVPKSGGAHVQSSVDAVHQKGGTVKVHLEMPPEGNYLIAYATTENYKSYEVKNEGGIWLRALSDKICEKAATESVTNILTEVNKVLAKTYQNSAYREALTQPDFNCKLQDTLYLVPKAHGASVPTPPGLKQRCLSQEGGVSPKSGENYKSFLNRAYQLESISKPMYPKPEETSNGLFIGKVTFTIRESGEEVTFVSNLPERTHKEVWESAAKRASDYLISRGIVNKSGVETPSNSNNRSSASPLLTKVSTPTSSATASPSLLLPREFSSPDNCKPPMMRLKEYREKNRLEVDYSIIKEQGQSFQYKAIVKKLGGKIVMEGTGEVRGSKKDAKHSAAKKILERLQ